jgi:hypothetical protein
LGAAATKSGSAAGASKDKKKMKKLPLVMALLAVGLVVGCRIRSPAPTYFPPLPSAIEDVHPATIPPVGTTHTVGIGEALLTQGDVVDRDFIVIPRDQEIGSETVRKGTYAKTEQTSALRGFVVLMAKKTAVIVNRRASLYLFSKDDGSKTACVSRTICGPLDYSIDHTSTFMPASFQQTLLYSGRIGNRITLGYREFSNNSARPAFNNDVAYDLSESTTLGYKGARLQVIKATNTEIQYKVVASFNKEQ